MWSKLTANNNPWIAADNLERFKVAATILGYGLAVTSGLICLVIGLLQA